MKQKKTGFVAGALALMCVVVLIQTSEAYNAQELLGNATGCNKIARYRNDGSTVGFETHIKGYAFNNFNVSGGMGYFVFCTNSSNLTVTGTPMSSATDNLYSGWNLYGWVSSTSSTASAVVNAITYANKIARYVGGFETHMKGYAFNNFNVTRGNGYFIYVTNTTSWTR